jgi:hypothetical protein
LLPDHLCSAESRQLGAGNKAAIDKQGGPSRNFVHRYTGHGLAQHPGEIVAAEKIQPGLWKTACNFLPQQVHAAAQLKNRPGQRERVETIEMLVFKNAEIERHAQHFQNA